jgi:hypothetical protein
VATTVIEVGVDVPNASLMIIENPERLGLAQLHQLRGGWAVARRPASCVLLYQTPLSANGAQRLGGVRETTTVSYIAEKDLELRGPGEVLGTRQTGEAMFPRRRPGRATPTCCRACMRSPTACSRNPRRSPTASSRAGWAAPPATPRPEARRSGNAGAAPYTGRPRPFRPRGRRAETEDGR